MAVKEIVVGASLFSMCVLFSACTQTGDNTTVGSAAGGVVGAGLGAIVGNQVGSTGGGLAIGALAGAGAGAAVGSALDGQQEAIRSQDEAIERQERVILAQQSELNELRKMGQDGVSFSDDLNRQAAKLPQQAPQQWARNDASVSTRQLNAMEGRAANTGTQGVFDQTAQPEGMQRRPSQAPTGTMQERDITPRYQAPTAQVDRPSQAQGAYAWNDSKQVQAPDRVQVNGGQPFAEPLSAAKANSETLSPPTSTSQPRAMLQQGMAGNTHVDTSAALKTPECMKANEEARSAATAVEAADKLFHLRRALRLCPDNAAFHTGLGEVYLSLNRAEDARYEFQEALRLNPNSADARSNLSSMN